MNDHRQPWALEARDVDYAYPGGIAALCGVISAPVAAS